MVKLEIHENDGNQRLDRFLKKYLRNAPLSYIYKLIRKDVKVNGKRAKMDTVLYTGDEISLYMEEEQFQSYTEVKKHSTAKRQFGIAYEDENILLAEKPFGLLTHGDAHEKKNTLANQVCGYLQEKGEYNPGREKVFVPSPVNRLDRNTTGLVIFGKNARALQSLNHMIRQKSWVSKRYLTVTWGEIKEELRLVDKMQKDSSSNRISVLPLSEQKGKVMETAVYPIAVHKGFTLAEIDLITGRTHQIRAHLAQKGFPIIGDLKYGSPQINQRVKRDFGLTSQLLHAYKLQFRDTDPFFKYLKDKEFTANPPAYFERIKKELFD